MKDRIFEHYKNEVRTYALVYKYMKKQYYFFNTMMLICPVIVLTCVFISLFTKGFKLWLLIFSILPMVILICSGYCLFKTAKRIVRKRYGINAMKGTWRTEKFQELKAKKLADFLPMTKMDFLRRYVEGQTLQYDTKGPEQLGKGPIVLCLDQSGSMTNQDTISKGFALALMSIARKQRRDFAWIPFSTYAADPMIYERGKIAVQDMIHLATFFLDGGTKFEPPLKAASEVIKLSRFNQADIVFVTDGESHVSDQFLRSWNELKEKKGFSVLSLLLGNESIQGVQNFSDRIVRASSFEDESVY